MAKYVYDIAVVETKQEADAVAYFLRDLLWVDDSAEVQVDTDFMIKLLQDTTLSDEALLVLTSEAFAITWAVRHLGAKI